MAAASWRLIADIGGTNIRFARARSASADVVALSHPASFALARFATIGDAVRAYLTAHPEWDAPESAVFGAAGPVAGGMVSLTNAPFAISELEMTSTLGIERVRLINDVEAVARAIPVLSTADLEAIHPARPPAIDGIGGAALAVNVGTGFGAGAVRRYGEGARDIWGVSATEAGHMSACHLPDAWGMATVEDFLSGPGVVRAANAIAAEQRVFADTQEVFTAAANDAFARETVDMFGRALGRICRDLVLAHGAWHGVYLVGSVALGWVALGNLAPFRGVFGEAGAMTDRLAKVPVFAVRRRDPALLGLAAFEI